MRLRTGLLALVPLLAACDGGGGSSTFDLPRLEWTWVEVEGAVCADGSPTGLAVNPGPEGSTDVLVFLMGGGACWDWVTCNAAVTASRGPYGATQFDEERRRRLEGSVLDRTVEGSPFGGATLVFIPYCTGDVHWGDAERDYGWEHRGARNLGLDAAWITTHLPAPGKLVVSGSSAGGFGSLLAHDLLRSSWPDAKGYLVDDSGPPFVGGDVILALRAAWFLSWGLDGTLDRLCEDDACFGDLSQAVVELAEKYPDDRIALLSTREDLVIRSFFGFLPADEFEESLLELVDTRIEPLEHGAAFLVPGDGHALLEQFAAWSADETPLPDWINQMVNDDPGWNTLGRAEPPALRDAAGSPGAWAERAPQP